MGFRNLKGFFPSWLVLVTLVQIGVAIADPGIVEFFRPETDTKSNEENASENLGNASSGKNLSKPDSKFHILVQEIQIPLESLDEFDPNHNHLSSQFNQTHKVPPVEFEKLKDAAKQAGLSDAKADRVARAAKLLNTSFDEVSELRKVMLNPATSADHADQVRQKLEEAAIQQQTQPTSNQIFTGQQQSIFQGAGPVNGGPIPLATIEALGASQTKFQPNPNPVYPNPNLQTPNAPNVIPVPIQVPLSGPVPVRVPLAGSQPQPLPSVPKLQIDPLTLHRINVSSTLAGLKANETARFLRALVESDLNATQASNLQNLMTQHAPTADDLKKLTKVLEKNVTLREIYADNANQLNAQGSEWLYSPSASSNTSDQSQDRKARSFIDINTVPKGEHRVFSAVHHCGVSPKYPVTQWSNVAPGQYPWSVGVLTSDDVFLCSGSLISEDIVLTTASCILKYQKSNLPLKLVIGAWDLPDDPYVGLPQLSIFAKSAVTHASYKENNADIAHNIGLLRLTQSIDFDLYPHIFPICIVNRALLSTALSDQCTVTGWPELPCDVNQKQPKSYLTGTTVTGNVNGCPLSAKACINGPANIANEGSPVICTGSTQRYYQWGLVASEPSGKRADVVNVAAVSVVDNYDFIARYLWT